MCVQDHNTTQSIEAPMNKHLAPLAVSALFLAGCGGDATPSPTPTTPSTLSTTETTTVAPEPVVYGPGTYTFSTPYGTTGTMEVPGEPVAEIEELRELSGAQEVTYITATVDNREGEEAFDFYMVSVYDLEGVEYVYTPAGEYVSEIRPDDAPAELYNRYIDLSNSLVEIVDPLQKADSVLVGPPLPDEITGVVVSNGFEQFDATPAK